MSKETWTYLEEQALLDLRYLGIPYSEIAIELGRTENSLRKRHFRLMKEAFTPEWYKKIEEYEKTLEAK